MKGTAWVMFGVASLAACAASGTRPAATSSAPAPLAPLRLSADSVRADSVAPGVVHHYFYIGRGPWAVHVLEADLARCWSPVALKAPGGAVGRERTSALAAAAADSARVAGAVNADFFLFTPPGVPVSAHVHRGEVVAGPGERPVFAVDSERRPWIGVLQATGLAIAGRDTIDVAGWNRAVRRGVALFDARWGPRTDSASGVVRLSVRAGRVVVVDSGTAGVEIPADGMVLVAGRDAPASMRSFIGAARPGDSLVVMAMQLAPLHPREAVGGFPVLVRDSVEAPALDSAGAASFAPVRHPRTIVGVAARGRRLLLVTVDGRQAGYSVGMTLRELAALMLDLGARDALNLDGGGSTTMVIADRNANGRFAIANRPSDAQGERPVANALAIVASCAGS